MSTPTPTADLATHANGAAPAVGSNGSARRKAKHTSIPALIKEAETLKDILRDALGRSHGLLVALRRQKKQAQVVQSTLAALKGLQKAER